MPGTVLTPKADRPETRPGVARQGTERGGHAVDPEDLLALVVGERDVVSRADVERDRLRPARRGRVRDLERDRELYLEVPVACVLA